MDSNTPPCARSVLAKGRSWNKHTCGYVLAVLPGIVRLTIPRLTEGAYGAKGKPPRARVARARWGKQKSHMRRLDEEWRRREVPVVGRGLRRRERGDRL